MWRKTQKIPSHSMTSRSGRNYAILFKKDQQNIKMSSEKGYFKCVLYSFMYINLAISKLTNVSVLGTTISPNEPSSQDDNKTKIVLKTYKVDLSSPPEIEKIIINFSSPISINNSKLALEQIIEEKASFYLSPNNGSHRQFLISNQIRFCPGINLCWTNASIRDDKCCEDCSCDSETCMETRSCCPDVLPPNYLQYTGMDLTVFNLSKTMNTSIQDSFPEIPTCEPIRMIPTYSEQETGYFMVSTCPWTQDSEFKNNCTRVYDINFGELINYLPVYNHVTSITYRNVYCALCNNIEPANCEFWKPMVKCGDHFYSDIKSNFVPSDIKTVCNIKFEIPGDEAVPLMPCRSAVSRCNITGYWERYDHNVEAGCLTYRSIVVYGGRNYQNIFCLLCNEKFPAINECNNSSAAKWSSGVIINGQAGYDNLPVGASGHLGERGEQGFYSFTGLISLYDTQLRSIRPLDFRGFYYSEEKDANTLCNPLSRFQNGQCVNMFEYIITDVIYIINLRIQSERKITIKEVFDVRLSLIDAVKQVVNSDVNFTDANHSVCELSLFLKSSARFGSDTLYISESAFIHGELEMKIEYSGKLTIEDVADSVQHIYNKRLHVSFENQNFVFSMTAKDVHDFPQNITETFEIEPKHKNDTGDSDIELVLKNLEDSSFPDKDNLTLILAYKSDMVSCNFNQTGSRRSIIKTLHYTSCPKVNLSLSEESVQRVENGINLSGQVIDLNQYYYEGTENIIVCVSGLQSNDHVYSDSFEVELILSIIFSSLSLFSLFISLCTYCYFNELRRNVPGKNTLALITSLLTSQVLFLIGSFGSFQRHSVSCAVVSMFVHFSWLTALFYMNICTYYMYKTLTGMRIVSSSSGVKTCVYYIVYVISMSLVFVLLNVVIATILSEGFGYGGMYCYISSQLRIMITVGFPVSYVILTNAGMFIAVIVKLKQAPSLVKNVKRERNDLLIFAKLSTITGATWIFGLLYAWTNMVVFSYMFIVLNAGQGVFIMFAFIFNRRVFQMIKQVCINKNDRTVTTKST